MDMATTDNSAKRAFSIKLNHELYERGWTPAELLRRAQVHLEKGDTLSKQAMHTYVNGRAIPHERRLQAIAKALGVNPFDLLASHKVPLEVTATDDGKHWLRINQEVFPETALKILEILRQDEERARAEGSAE